MKRELIAVDLEMKEREFTVEDYEIINLVIHNLFPGNDGNYFKLIKKFVKSYEPRNENIEGYKFIKVRGIIYDNGNFIDYLIYKKNKVQLQKNKQIFIFKNDYCCAPNNDIRFIHNTLCGIFKVITFDKLMKNKICDTYHKITLTNLNIYIYPDDEDNIGNWIVEWINYSISKKKIKELIVKDVLNDWKLIIIYIYFKTHSTNYIQDYFSIHKVNLWHLINNSNKIINIDMIRSSYVFYSLCIFEVNSYDKLLNYYNSIKHSYKNDDYNKYNIKCLNAMRDILRPKIHKDVKKILLSFTYLYNDIINLILEYLI